MAKCTKRVKLTKKIVDGLVVCDSKELFVWDTDIKGFGVKIYPSGRKSYIIQYRDHLKREKRYNIGVHGQITIETARDQARLIAEQASQSKTLIKLGINVESPKVRSQATEKYTVKCLVQDYLDTYAPGHLRPGTIEKEGYYIRLYVLPEWRHKRIGELNREDVEAFKSKLKDKKPTANQVIGLMSSMYNRAIDWGKASENPFSKVKKYKEHKRLRWADGEEFEKLWSVLLKYKGYVSANVLIFILLTGSRKGEVFQASWDQFDLDRGVWIKPHTHTKQQRDEYIPLSEQALEFLAELKSCAQDKYLFPGRIPGTPVTDVKKFWTTVLKEANIENLRVHDLRHTFASHLVSSGLSLNIVGKLLGHSNSATTQRYAHLADQALRDATNVFSAKVKKLTQKEAG